MKGRVVLVAPPDGGPLSGWTVILLGEGEPGPPDAVTYRQMDHWVRAGLLRPENPSPGSGWARRWTAKECAVVRLMARLVTAGLSPALAHQVARADARRVELAAGVVVEVG